MNPPAKMIQTVLLLLCGLRSVPAFAGQIMTVCGPIDGRDLGMTLTHEHILVDFIGAEETGPHRWDRDEVVARTAPYLSEISRLGFRSLIECTPAYLGRDPALLQNLSEKTGLHLITNTGYYGARKNKFIPRQVRDLTVDQLASRWIDEFRIGIGDTGIRPGFIKIGVDRDPLLSGMHEKLLRAACRAHLKTGLVIACHTGPSPVIFRMAAILKEEGVPPDALIWVHATRDTPENQIRAAQSGLWVSIDNVQDTPQSLDIAVGGLTRLKEAGLLHRVLISHDAGWYRAGEPGGGEFRPYTAISNALLPRLRAEGFEQADVDQLLIHNPRRAFELRPAAP
jgi:phosphotriesterase-related protein